MKYAKWIVLAFVLSLSIPALGLPQGRWDNWGSYGRIDNKDAAYRAGYHEGYRDGSRQASFDWRDGRRPNYRFRESDRRFGYGFNNSRYGNDFKKGYRNGYREGYREAYNRHRGGRW
jgi:hypothetical protein